MFSRLVFSAALFSVMAGASASQAAGDDPLQIFVSKDSQSLVVYDGDRPVATSKVSTGKPGHTTPSGIFSILEKRRTHFSSTYDDAPMPYMQRLTWSGVALHESAHVPSYPASHGCVRMPGKFAKSLYSMTQRGFHVVISDQPLTPAAIHHKMLFVPSPDAPVGELLSDAVLRPAAGALDSGTQLAMAEVLPKAGAAAVATLPEPRDAVRILITRTPQSVQIADIQQILNQLGYDAGPADGLIGRKTTAAIKAYQALHGQKETGLVTPELSASVHKVVNTQPPANGRLFVRSNFKQIYEAPVVIAEPQLALGTHFFSASHVSPASQSVDWFAVSLDNPLSPATMKRFGIDQDSDAYAANGAQAVLDRLTIAPDVRSHVEKMLGNGSSLTISDVWSRDETGLGTDFITILNKPRSNG